MIPRTSQHEQKTWTHIIRQHWTTLLHVFTFLVHGVLSLGSCCSMLSYYMCSRFLFMWWCPGDHDVQCCLITCVLVFCSWCDVLGFMLFNVVLLHVFTFFVHAVMSWGSCCSMVSYYMCSRFLFMLWCPVVHVVQCCIITCVHVFCSCSWTPGHHNMNKKREHM
jgi:hypothetical protein